MILPVFLHIEATPKANPSSYEVDALKGYMEQASRILERHGGVKIATYDVERTIDGLDGPKVFIVMSFPTRESILALFEDPAYKSIVPLRDAGFSRIRFYVTSERI